MTGIPQADPHWLQRPGVVVAAALLLVSVLFWPTFASFPSAWGPNTGRSHGWFIAGLVAWLIWSRRADLLEGLRGPRTDPLLLLVLGLASVGWLVSYVAHIQVFHQIAFVAVLFLWALVVLGNRAIGPLAALATTFALALPIWGVLVPPLRRATTLVSGTAVKLMGIEAIIDGDIIHIRAGTFLVEDGCAGLSYLIAGLVVAAFYAHLLVRGSKTKLKIVALGAAIAIVGNWIRVAAIIVIGHVTAMESPLIEAHGTFGWFVFAAGLVPFFLLALWIEKRDVARRALEATGPDGANEDAGAAASAAPAEPAEGVEGAAPNPARLAIAGAVAALGPLLYLGVGALPASEPAAPTLADMTRGEGWAIARDVSEAEAPWQPEYQGAQEEELVAFTEGVSRVQGHRFVYRDQRQGAKLIGYPNRIAAGSEILDQRVVGPVDPAGRRWVQQVVVRTDAGARLVWYWYRIGGVETFSPVHAKALELPAFVRRHRTAELVALSADCSEEGCQEAFRLLSGFSGQPRSPTADRSSPEALRPESPDSEGQADPDDQTSRGSGQTQGGGGRDRSEPPPR